MRPAALALGPGGDLLIADAFRNQVLEWQPDGTLSVYAGTGQPGFSGDGGPAIDARFSRLGDIAIAPDGTLYVVDANRVRAIAANGTITTVAGDGRPEDGTSSISRNKGVPATKVALSPSAVAVSPRGQLYIASASGIERIVQGDKISAFLETGRRGLITVESGRQLAFSPATMAFDGAGNLDVVTSGPRELLRIAPNGVVTDLGSAEAAQLALGPDGSVYAAGHAESIWKVTAAGKVVHLHSLLGRRVQGLSSPGEQPGLEPSGIAVAPSGAIYLDSFNGNGWSVGTTLVTLSGGGLLKALPIDTGLLDTLPGVRSADFPAAVYPDPIPVAAGTPIAPSDPASCPSSSGIEPFNATARRVALKVARRFNAYVSTFWGDLRSTDRSWWPELFAEWTGAAYDRDTHHVVSIGPAEADGFAAAATAACGAALVRDSLVVDVGPSAYSFQVSHLFLLDRSGHPLIWLQAS